MDKKNGEMKLVRLTDRAAYLRGLAEGMGIRPDTNQNRLLLEMLEVMGEMAEKIGDLDADIGDLEEYVEDIDADLSDMEEALFDEDDGLYDHDDDEDDEDDEDDDDEDDEDSVSALVGDEEELSFDCPSCGETVLLKASDIDFDESPVCAHCGKPFFADTVDGTDVVPTEEDELTDFDMLVEYELEDEVEGEDDKPEPPAEPPKKSKKSKKN